MPWIYTFDVLKFEVFVLLFNAIWGATYKLFIMASLTLILQGSGFEILLFSSLFWWELDIETFIAHTTNSPIFPVFFPPNYI